MTLPVRLSSASRMSHVHPNACRLLIDVLSWIAAIGLAATLQQLLARNAISAADVAALVSTALVVQIAVGYAIGLYRGGYRPGSFDELPPLAATVAGATALLAVGTEASRSADAMSWMTIGSGGCYALTSMCVGRASWRLLSQHAVRQQNGSATVAIVFGAGDAGAQLISSLLRDQRSSYRPLALLDDDVTKRKLRICGVPVAGGRDALGAVARRVGAQALLIAIPSASASLIARLTADAEGLGLDVKVLPSLAELLDPSRVGERDIRDVAPGDLLGRRPIVTDVDTVAAYITGRRVLVTGAGGSIGSELCIQLHRHHPARLVLLDRDESALHAVQLAIHGRALLDSDDLALVDIRDAQSLQRVFTEQRPEIVFHAAALKHLPLLERHPGEAVRTNVVGTLNVLEAASAVGVRRFVNVSTDKAADPESVLGYSKRLTERLTATFADDGVGCYLSVRFGNVVGSRGSVFNAFQRQIMSGGPVTVTDPGVTRYFMTVHEAVQLVIQAGGIGRPGEVLIFDMGEPILIKSVAEMLISLANQPICIEYTGLRPGEKLHERLFGAGEADHRPNHPLISQVSVPALPTFLARGLNPSAPRDRLIREMRALCTAQYSFEPEVNLTRAEARPLTGSPRP